MHQKLYLEYVSTVLHKVNSINCRVIILGPTELLRQSVIINTFHHN